MIGPAHTIYNPIRVTTPRGQKLIVRFAIHQTSPKAQHWTRARQARNKLRNRQ